MLPGRVTGVVIGCASTGPNLSTLLNLGCRVPEQAGSNIRRSATAFMEAGGTHAHFLYLLFGVTAAVVAGACYVRGLQDKLVFLEAEIQRSRDEARDRIERARAEAIQQTRDKFLMYGYAAEHKAFQEKALGKKE